MVKGLIYSFFGILCLNLLVGCGNNAASGYVPVEERTWRPQTLLIKSYVVQRGDTLYSVAFRYDKDYRTLAAYNRLKSPYNIHVGQVLKFQPRGYRFLKPEYKKLVDNKSAYNKSRSSHNFARIRQPYRPIVQPHVVEHISGEKWRWPANGRVVSHFFPAQGKKGIDIAGKKGAGVVAASDGIVAYSGNGLVGYGNLIIVKHNNQFLTAYGNNARNRVSEGQVVKAGQVIADMGVIDRRFWGVHFEIRKTGQPVNPMVYLHKR